MSTIVRLYAITTTKKPAPIRGRHIYLLIPIITVRLDSRLSPTHD